ncbi:MAG: hypothetical protein WKF51_13655 [Geodermatophilaceae bacterium]
MGVGSFLTVEFGSPRTTSVGVTQGAFHLWIYGSSWDIRKGRDSIATSEQDRVAMIAGARALDDAIVRGFKFDPNLMTLTLRLDSDLELVTSPLGDADMEEWLLYLDDGTVITAGPGRSIIRESAAASSVEPGC